MPADTHALPAQAHGLSGGGDALPAQTNRVPSAGDELSA
jgi:hypothetical protein